MSATQHPDDSPALDLLDHVDLAVVDELTAVARRMLGSAGALVSLLRGSTLQWLAASPAPTQVDQGLHGSSDGSWSAPTVFCQQVASTGAPLAVADTRELGEGAALPSAALVDLTTRAYCGVPLTGVDGQVVGVLCAVETAPRSWTSDDVGALRQLAVLASSELASRQLGARSALSRQRAESAAGQARLLLALSEALADTETFVDVAEAVDTASADVLGVSWSYVGLVDERAHAVRFVPITGRPGDNDAQWQSVPVGEDHPAGWVAAHAQPIVFDDARALRRQFPGTWSPTSGPIGYEASIHLPLLVGRRLVGVLSLLYDQPRHWTLQERTALAALARYTAQALDRALLLADRVSVAQTLQRAMLTDLPEPDHLHVAARYLASSSSDQVGGDWYDAFLTPDGAIALAIGDVTGHDISAAAAMGQLRAILRGYGVDRDELPSDTLRRLDRAMRILRIDTLATAVLARIEQGDAEQRAGMRRLRWSNAGHPAPILVHPDGRTQVLHTAPEVLLGLLPDTQRTSHTIELAPGSTLFFYTDGLTERRGVDLDDAEQALSDQLARLHQLPLHELLDRVLEGAHTDADDDIAVLAVRMHPEDRPRPPEAGPSTD